MYCIHQEARRQQQQNKTLIFRGNSITEKQDIFEIFSLNLCFNNIYNIYFFYDVLVFLFMLILSTAVCVYHLIISLHQLFRKFSCVYKVEDDN